MKKQWSDEQLQKALKRSKATMEIEGFHIPNEDDALIKKRLKNELSHEGFIQIAKERAKYYSISFGNI